MKYFTLLLIAVFVLIGGCTKKTANQDVSSESDTSLLSDTVIDETKDIKVEDLQTQAPSQESVTEAPSSETPTSIAATEGFEEPSVKEMQQALKNAGLYQGKVDGVLGPKTQKAIEDFQAQNGLVIDGKVGPKTWGKLKDYLTKTQ
jgi:peptidoglycan hydrolase-like protein with peptidoglycan-binding domain